MIPPYSLPNALLCRASRNCSIRSIFSVLFDREGQCHTAAIMAKPGRMGRSGSRRYRRILDRASWPITFPKRTTHTMANHHVWILVSAASRILRHERKGLLLFSRVSSIKTLTIPRLELIAALLLVRLRNAVRRALSSVILTRRPSGQTRPSVLLGSASPLTYCKLSWLTGSRRLEVWRCRTGGGTWAH